MNSVQIQVHGVSITPLFAGVTAAGLYQINITLPQGLGTGDQPLVATVLNAQTQSTVVVALQ
jgi:uncharacterized protein (TIGR03437 family)